MRREGRAQGLEHPQMPTYLLPVVAGTVGSLPGGDGHSATTTWDIPVPPDVSRSCGSSRQRQHSPERASAGTMDSRDKLLLHTWLGHQRHRA